MFGKSRNPFTYLNVSYFKWAIKIILSFWDLASILQQTVMFKTFIFVKVYEKTLGKTKQQHISSYSNFHMFIRYVGKTIDLFLIKYSF